MLAYGRCKATKEVFSDYKRFVSFRGVGIQDFIDTKDLAKEIYKITTVKLKEDQLAGILVRSLLSAGIDTSASAIGNLLFCFAENSEQFQLVKNDKSLVGDTIK